MSPGKVSRVVAVLAVMGLTLSVWSACLDALALMRGETACAMMRAEHDCGQSAEMIRCCLEDADKDTRFTVVAKAPSEKNPLLPAEAGFGLPAVALPESISAAATDAFVQARLKLPSDPTYLRISVFRI
jgi:hypothetical protein